jgi:hypothetical protein
MFMGYTPGFSSKPLDFQSGSLDFKLRPGEIWRSTGQSLYSELAKGFTGLDASRRILEINQKHTILGYKFV